MSNTTLWFKNYRLEELNYLRNECIHNALGIEITELGSDFICGKMPIDKRTKQPVGILHGGASVVLAESLGSIASNLVLDPEKFYAVGQAINAQHIRPGIQGYVHGKAVAVHLGSKTHIWNIDILNDEHKLVCSCRLTMAILPKLGILAT